MRQGLLSDVTQEAVLPANRRSPAVGGQPIPAQSTTNGSVKLSHVANDRPAGKESNRPLSGLAAPGELDSLDFDSINNPYWVDKCRRPPRRILGYSGKTFARWVLTILIGVGVALAARFISFNIEIIAKMRNNVLQSFFDEKRPDQHAFAFFVVYNLCLTAASTCMTVFLEPSAAGGGIPELQAYLNGTHVKNFLRLRAILVKIFGTVLSVSSGLACGQEGPMIHIGAGIASGVTRGEKLYRKLMCFELATPKKLAGNSVLKRFKNDRDRREFICAGAGAGMAAAFGAPVGGVLFALEEAASHWSPALIWRVFTACLVATFTLAFVKAGDNNGDISLAGLLSFGTVRSVGDMKREIMNDDGTVNVSLFFFGLIGIGGGVLGGIWNHCWDFIASVRSKYLIYPWRKIAEVLCVSVLTSSVVFLLAYSFPACRNNGSWTCRDAENWGEWCGGAADNTTCLGNKAQCVNASGWVCRGGDNNGKACRGLGDCEWRGGKCTPIESEEVFGVRLGCPVGQYDELATIFFGTREHSIVRLITQAYPHMPFTNHSLLVAGLTYLCLMLLTYGIALPAGLFMPSVLVGAALGRLVGQLVKQHIDNSVFSGAYALAGAAAMLGGVQRATISLVVIIIEGTANVHFLLPIVVTTCTAKFVGNMIGHEGVYEIGLRRKKLRFLDHEPEWQMDLTVAGDVMARPVVSLNVVDTIGNIVKVLQNCKHNGFPVLSLGPDTEQPPEGVPPSDGCQTGRLEGIILRSQLRTLLGARFESDDENYDLWRRITSSTPTGVPLDGELRLYELMSIKARTSGSGAGEWEWGSFTEADLSLYVNLGSYMNAAPYFVHENCPLSRAYSVFRNLGLRHLPVIDVQNQVVGMLTRSNFLPETLHRIVKSYYREQDMIQSEYGEEVRSPRLRGLEQLVRNARREPIIFDGKELGGEHGSIAAEGGYFIMMVTQPRTHSYTIILAMNAWVPCIPGSLMAESSGKHFDQEACRMSRNSWGLGKPLELRVCCPGDFWLEVPVLSCSVKALYGLFQRE